MTDTRNGTAKAATLGARVSAEEQRQAKELEARFGNRWKVFRGAWEWYGVRRCHPCPRPEVHGSWHIAWAATLEKLAELLTERDAAEFAGGRGSG